MEVLHKQVRKLTDEQKAEIVIAKETRPTATSTNCNLAVEFDCSESLVDHLNYKVLTERQKEIYNLKRAELKYLAQNLTYNAMQEANNRVIAGTGKLSEVVGALKVAHDIYRLESGQSTVNVLDQAAMLQSLVNYCKLHANGPRQLAAMVMFAEGSGVDESLRRKEAERILLDADEKL